MLFGSPFQRNITTATSISPAAGTDAIIVTTTATITLPPAHLCTLEQGNNTILIASGAGVTTTVAPTSPDTMATAANASITAGKAGLCMSDGLSKWYVISV